MAERNFNVDDATSTVAVGFKQSVFTKYAFEIDEDIAKGYTKSLFTSFSEFLKIVKNEEEPVLLEVSSLTGEFLFGAAVRYNKNDDPTKPGNWVFSYTFNAEDVADIRTRYLYTDPQFGVILSNTMYTLFNYVWNVDSDTAKRLTIGCIESIRNFLEANAVEGDVTTLTCGDLFVATSGIENGEKVMAITPGEKSKEIVKEPKAN